MRNNPLHKALLLIAFSFWASAVADAQAKCKPVYLYTDLKAGIVANTDPTHLIVLSGPTPSTNPDCAGWNEMVVQVDIPQGCTAAIVDVDYEGTPQNFQNPTSENWTLNIGDSATNDGWSGDYGTTARNAELWIMNQGLWLANAGGSPSVIDDPLIFNNLSLTDSGMKFLIKDQFVSWGQPYQLSQTPNNQLLFAIPDTTVTPADQRSIYVGLNRVIYTGVNNRTGCGLRTAVIRFQ